MEISKSIVVPRWDGEQMQKAIRFWVERGFAFKRTDSIPLMARRGSLWGNLTSFNMGRLAATLTITNRSPNTIDCTMTVSTLFQDITEWNQAYWNLEMDTFESWLLHGDNKETEWREFLKGSRKAAVAWTLTLRAKGRKMPPSGGGPS